MKMREFVNIINLDIKDLPLQSEIKTIYDLESAIAIFNLNKVLQANVNNDANTSKKSLESFFVLLATRWDTIRDTDAIEQYNPNTNANKIFRKVAKLLASSMNSSAAKYLMPTLRISESNENKDLLDLHPHQYILDDNSSTAIEIYHCLDNARSGNMAKNNKEAKMLCHTAKGLTKKELSVEECARITDHSALTKEYFERLSKYNFDEMKVAKNKLKQGLEARECAVIPGYKDKGLSLLREKLYATIDSREKLFTTLLSLPKDMWRAYCKHMGVNKFIQIMSNGKISADDILTGKSKIEDILEKDYLSGAKDEIERCKLFCLYAMYAEAKDNGIYYHGYKNMLAIWPIAFTDKRKVDSVEQVLAAIIELNDLSQLPAKLTDSPLKQGVLGKFTVFTQQHLTSSSAPVQPAPVTEAKPGTTLGAKS